MKNNSILMKQIRLSSKDGLFGNVLFNTTTMYKVDTRLFNSINEKIESIKFIILSMLSILTHKKQNEDLAILWQHINKERKKDKRINKEILKNNHKNHFYDYHERKNIKLTLKDSRVNFPVKYLFLISQQLVDLKYYMEDTDYSLYRDKLLMCVSMLFRTNSEFGYAPVIKYVNVFYLEKFYSLYPELLQLNISQSDSCELYFSLMLRIWNLTNNEKYLKDLDIAFDRMKSSNSKGYSIDVENKMNLIISNAKYKDKLPHFEKFQKTKNYIYFKEFNVTQWNLDISVLQKWTIGKTGISLSPSKLLNSLEWLMSFDVNSLELCQPLKKIYLDESKTNICFVFHKDEISDLVKFENYWINILSGILVESENIQKKLILESINKHYLLDLSIPNAKNKSMSRLVKF